MFYDSACVFVFCIFIRNIIRTTNRLDPDQDQRFVGPDPETNLHAKVIRMPILSHSSKLNQQKQWDIVSKRAANIYPSNKYDFFPIILLLTYHKTLYNLIIVLSFNPLFEPITAFFYNLQVVWANHCLFYNLQVVWANHCLFYNYRSVTY